LQIINLAAHLQDGRHIQVPFKGQELSSAAGPMRTDASRIQAAQEHASPAKAVNVNTATAAELESLPGVGPAIAERIVRHREEKGRFHSLEGLDAVKGLGPKKLHKVQPYVVF
jgi:competence protein ComEA